MKKIIKKIFWGFLLLSYLLPHPALATSGTPNSSNFGYGVRVNLSKPDYPEAIKEAGNYNFDWIAIDLNWQHIQSEGENPPSWQELDTAMALAKKYQLAVMISITQAPHWAMNQDGPDPEKTVRLAKESIQRYPGITIAMEIFPSANTRQGWGTSPNPKAYTSLLISISKAIKQLSTDVLIVGGGLTPVTESSEGMDDLQFLDLIYSEGIAEFMPVVGLRLLPSGSDPLERDGNSGDYPLRRYEDIRNIMSVNGHKHGLIWITGFSWDFETISNSNEQADWMKQAYLLFRSQLYIGVAFFDGLNSSLSKNSQLLFQDNNHHPAFDVLIQMIAQDNNQQTIIISLELSKRIRNKNYPKAHSQ